MRQLARERLNVGIMVVVAGETALEITLEYCRERTAFGQPINSFQNSRSGWVSGSMILWMLPCFKVSPHCGQVVIGLELERRGIA